MRSNKFDVAIFDIDNVIADTRFSYTDCIRETVQIYLGRYFKFKTVLSKKDVEQFKLLGGFNDDWDTCYGLILYFTAQNKNRLKPIEINQLSKKIKMPVGVRGIERFFGKNAEVKMSRIARIFQKLYWTKYISREWPIIPKKVFKKLKKSGVKLGIATGRTRREANYVLRRFKIRNLIQKMVCATDLPNRNFKKPHTYSLIKIGKSFGMKNKYIYVGDLPDDMNMGKKASKKMTIESWGFLALSSNKKEMKQALRKAGAQKIIETKKELISELTHH